jgi:phosphoglycerol transferase MdoB-like AlkP superfamily enzyme
MSDTPTDRPAPHHSDVNSGEAAVETPQRTPNRRPLPNSRYGLAGLWLFSLWLMWTALRVVLFIRFKPAQVPIPEALMAFLVGTYRDLFAALLLTLPLLGWMLVVPNRWFAAKWHEWLMTFGLFFVSFLQVFLLFVEWFFFDEFKSRFNTVAVDYLLFPQEVFGNIWQSYHVVPIVGLCLVLAAAWVFAARKLFPGMWAVSYRARTRLGVLAGAVLLTLALAFTFDFRQAQVSPERTLNEIANNGSVSFLAAAYTHNLDYAAFYKTMPRAEAYARVRRLLEDPKAQFLAGGESILRQINGEASRPKLNLVILLEESLGSEFWGSLGRKDTLTPEMDKLAAQEGMLFTNIYACGNRTVRGMEGVLSSFPPLPGDSIVKRDRSDNVETVARVLKRDGYSTVFLYGGRGVFDSMRSFSLRNGYDRFVEQKDIRATFTTIWGVCDEDLFAKSIDEFRSLASGGKPFFATVLSTSNHRPYTYPAGRIPEDPNKKWRRNAVKYSDFALGEFFRAAKKEPFWTNTVFVVIADHGARVYGEQAIPIHSYEIPLLVVGPAVVKAPSRVGTLGSSLDVSPTLLGLIGRPYQSLFFGRDLFSTRREQTRALLGHNRDIGMLARDRLVVLGLMFSSEFYAGNPKEVEMTLLPTSSASELELEKDAIALYQVADDLYTHRLYHLD